MRCEWFGPRLKELRTKAMLTQGQLAELTQGRVSRGGIANLEQGLRLPGWDSVLALAEALEVNVSAFAQEPANIGPTSPGRPKVAAESPVGKKGSPPGRPARTKQESPAQKRTRRAGRKGFRDLRGT
jgi:transcriptional regulator with XRE-family HTH domain